MSTTMAAAAVPPGGGMTVISRLERIDLMLLCLEEIKAGGRGGSWRKSSCLSTASSGGEGLMTVTDGGNSSESSLSEKKKERRNMEEAIVETKIKGSLIDRIIFLESRLLKLEENMEFERKREINEISSTNKSREKKKYKGLKSIIKSCVQGNPKT